MAAPAAAVAWPTVLKALETFGSLYALSALAKNDPMRERIADHYYQQYQAINPVYAQKHAAEIRRRALQSKG